MKTRSGHMFKRGKTWYVQWRVNGKLFMRSTKCTRKDEAEKERARIMAPFLAKDEATVLEHVAARIDGRKAEIAAYEDAKNPPLAIEDAWRRFLASPDRPDSGENTLKHYHSQYRRFARWMRGEHAELTEIRQIHPKRTGGATEKTKAIPMRAVDEAIAREYAVDLNGGKSSPSTFNQHIGFLKLLWKTLEDEIKTDKNPWLKIKRKKRTGDRSRRELTVDELRRIYDTTDGEMRLLFGLGIYTGLRMGDCATLRTGEVDLKRNLIRRVPMKVARRKPKPVTIPIHPTLHGMLSEAMDAQSNEYVLPGMAAYYAEERVWELSKAIQKHFTDNGISIHKPGTGKFVDEGGNTVDTGKRAIVEVGFHSLRHTFVSLCREHNVPFAVVEALVGHSNPAMTRLYTHVSEAAACDAMAVLPNVTGDVAVLALPEPATVNAEAVRKLAEKLTAKNGAQVKKELLALLDATAQ